MKVKTLFILLCLLLLAACGEWTGSTPIATVAEVPPTAAPDPTTTVAAPATEPNTKGRFLRDFEMVWRTVNRRYFDPTFGGLDWEAVHERYEPLIAAAESDETFYRLINQMLFELQVSHLVVVPPGGWVQAEPVISAPGEIGLTVRLLDGEAVITSVIPGLPADEAGLRTGFVIHSIDGVSIDEIITQAELRLAPPFNSRGRVDHITRAILAPLYGTPDTPVSIRYANGQSESGEKTPRRVARGRVSNSLGLSVFLEFEERRLEDGIGYIRFNTFNETLADEIVDAAASMHDAPGIIIDLRGNPGGDPNVGNRLAARLVRERTVFWKSQFRDRITEARVYPVEDAYPGPVVVLIDATSTSASELFAAGLQANGRAAVVGDHSPGSCLAADLLHLSSGATFLYPVVQVIAPDGTVIEGNGVLPDIPVALDAALLLEGRDSQLEAAIEYIQQKAAEK